MKNEMQGKSSLIENLRENDELNINGCQKVYRQLMQEIGQAQRKNELEGSSDLNDQSFCSSPSSQLKRPSLVDLQK